MPTCRLQVQAWSRQNMSSLHHSLTGRQTELRSWLRLQTHDRYTREWSRWLCSSPSPSRLHAFILTTGSVRAWGSIKSGNNLTFKQHSNGNQVNSSHCIIWPLSVLWHVSGRTLRNSLLSTCSLPSTSSIWKAIWNPVWGSATAKHWSLSALFHSEEKAAHCYWELGKASKPSSSCKFQWLTGQDGEQEQVLRVGYQTWKTHRDIL